MRKPQHRVRRVASPAADAGFELMRNKAGHAQLIGYARVSTREQSLDSQVDALRKAGCARIYAEKVSSVRAERPGWSALMKDARRGDTVCVVRLDRIGRKLAEVIDCVDELGREGAYVRSLTQGIDTRSANGRMTLPLWAALAETERELLIERTRAGLAAARERGRVGGRPPVLNAAKIEMCRVLRSRHHSYRQIAAAVGCSEATVRRALELDHDDPRQLRIEGT